jgi:hypothetical protein
VPATTSIASTNSASTITFRSVSPDPPPPRI